MDQSRTSGRLFLDDLHFGQRPGPSQAPLPPRTIGSATRPVSSLGRSACYAVSFMSHDPADDFDDPRIPEANQPRPTGSLSADQKQVARAERRALRYDPMIDRRENSSILTAW